MRCFQQADDEGRGRLEKEASKQEPGKETLAPVVAMLTRLIDRFETDDTRNRGS